MLLAPLGNNGAEGLEVDQPSETAADVDAAKVAVKPLRAPAAPTQEEIEEHETSAGRGHADAHVGDQSDEHALPTVAIDYTYLGNPAGEDDEKASPILVFKSARDR